MGGFFLRMHRFLGIEPPPQKKLKTPEEKRDGNKLYDKEKRVRSFQPSWQTAFSWLIHDQSNNKLYCKVCRSVYGPLAVNGKKTVSNKFSKYVGGTFVTGSSNFKRGCLSDHDASQGHKDAQTYVENRRAKPGESSAEKCLQNLNQAAFDRLSILFRNAHAIAMHSCSFKQFVWLADLDEEKGLTVGKTYRNDKQCKIFIKAIAEVERQKIEDELRNAKFISVLCDGSVDVSVTENEVVYTRFCIKGKVSVYFVGMQALSRANAPGIYKAIMDSLMFKHMPITDIEKKLVGFGSDGASVNTGKHHGVIALFHQNISTSIVMVHCMAHALELAFKKSVKSSPQVQKVYDKIYSLLSELFSFYHTSSLQTHNLKDSFTTLGISEAFPHRVGGTRWVSHLNGALNQVWKGYKAFVFHLTQVAAALRYRPGYRW
ncbi:zinc finger protein 862 [Lingula anatina]|uniref:Zinc finger protein 862 n=1 Tax=Lingula anatina TaxID=7574 RepID=A0A1S3HQN6_LINAN|nr:zinc finger protein 862 [Lingula anatina]|eukprot:XP_013387851.1 zinc finger protein 862 [Lingula anatina]